MRKKILAIIACVICLGMIAGVYVLANQKSGDNRTRYEVSVDIGGETFHGVVSMLPAEFDCCDHGGDYDSWSADIYVNDQPEQILEYSFDKCPSYYEMSSTLENNIVFVKNEGDCKVFVVSPIDKKRHSPRVIYSVDGDKFYQYEEECQLIRKVKKYEAGKLKRVELGNYSQTMKKYKDALKRHNSLYKLVSKEEMKTLK